jgi:hypothetical protein
LRAWGQFGLRGLAGKHIIKKARNLMEENMEGRRNSDDDYHERSFLDAEKVSVGATTQMP